MEKLQVVIHHSASSETTTVGQISEWHRTKNWGSVKAPAYCKKNEAGNYAQYHYVINDTGVHKNSESEHLWHCGIENAESIGVCLCGDYRFKPISLAQKATLEALLDDIRKRHPITSIKGHMECKGATTECPALLMNFVYYYKEHMELEKQVESLTKKLIGLLMEKVARLRKLLK